jgi:oligoribonuclease NrnB/cAMP/cGMP phosphodiesterase (DHH superfamily)
MLHIALPATELWNEFRQEFINTKAQSLQLEHSLVSISKWESKWQKPFLTKEKKTSEETLDYIKCMTLTQNVPSEVYNHLSYNNIVDINNYIESPMTATTIREQKQKSGVDEQLTSELIYYSMVALNIPFECQKWHLNRLITLIRVCNIKNTPPSKRSKREIMSRNATLNEVRKQQLNTKG